MTSTLGRSGLGGRLSATGGRLPAIGARRSAVTGGRSLAVGPRPDAAGTRGPARRESRLGAAAGRRARIATAAAALAFAAGWGRAPASEPLSVAPALAPLVKTISRPVHTYHYAMRVRLGLGASGYVAPDHPGRDEYVAMKIGRFWDLGIPVAPWATASGLYVGSDPVIPRAFGGVGDVWALVQVVLAPGFRVVDVRRWGDARQDGQRFPPAAAERLRAAGCDAEFPESLLVGLESAACRAIAVRTLRDLRVDGILYTFQRFGFRECPDRPAGGFIVLDGARLDAAGARLLTPESGDDAAREDRLIVRELFARARQAGSRRELPWPALAGVRPSTDVGAWMRGRLFGCGDYPEDAMPDLGGRHSALGGRHSAVGTRHSGVGSRQSVLGNR